MTVKGLEDFQHQIDLMSSKSIEMAKRSVYKGAEAVADRVREHINALPTIPDAAAINRYRKHEPAAITVAQKRGLQDGFGVAPIQIALSDINTKIGFDGYNAIRTKRWPNGQPNSMIARSIESGTSFMPAHPFIRPAVNASKNQAVKAMAKEFETQIDEITGG